MSKQRLDIDSDGEEVFLEWNLDLESDQEQENEDLAPDEVEDFFRDASTNNNSAEEDNLEIDLSDLFEADEGEEDYQYYINKKLASDPVQKQNLPNAKVKTVKPKKSVPKGIMFAMLFCTVLICILVGGVWRSRLRNTNSNQNTGDTRQGQIAHNENSSEVGTEKEKDTEVSLGTEAGSETEAGAETEADSESTSLSENDGNSEKVSESDAETESPEEASETEEKIPERTPEVIAIAEYCEMVDETFNAGDFMRFKLGGESFAYATKDDLMYLTVPSSDSKPYITRYYYQDRKLLCVVLEVGENEKAFYLQEGELLMTEGQLAEIEDPDLEEMINDAASRYKVARDIADRYM